MYIKRTRTKFLHFKLTSVSGVYVKNKKLTS